MKSIVCFGDSNTWGYDPATQLRFAPDTRWTGVLQRELGPGYRVIEEGLNGRSTNVDDPLQPHRNGLDYLPPCLESHHPFDLVTIMLGTNDLKTRFNRSASDIAESAANLANLARLTPFGPEGAAPKVLLIAPPPVAKLTAFDDMFAGSQAKSHDFARHYQEYASWYSGVAFLNAADVIISSDLDGIHFEAPEHEKLGHQIAHIARELIG
ncbi:MAG: SGNH/GDSL hydrolase family protein [Thermomicrobiales bacterium]